MFCCFSKVDDMAQITMFQENLRDDNTSGTGTSINTDNNPTQNVRFSTKAEIL